MSRGLGRRPRSRRASVGRRVRVGGHDDPALVAVCEFEIEVVVGGRPGLLDQPVRAVLGLLKDSDRNVHADHTHGFLAADYPAWALELRFAPFECGTFVDPGLYLGNQAGAEVAGLRAYGCPLVDV